MELQATTYSKIPSVSRVYANVLKDKPKEYWDYESITIQYGDVDKYLLVDKLGRGKFSEVFGGRKTADDSECVIKLLKPVLEKRVKREIAVLEAVRGGPNVIELLDVVKCAHCAQPSLVFDYVDNTDFKVLIKKLTDFDTRYYLYELLKALDFCHSKGIMHRDVKPTNVMINHETKTLRLIDWGLGEFYHPYQQYNVRVASRHYKSPELLVDYEMYDYAVDLWSFGCMMASMIFRKDVFFRGHDLHQQLVVIARVLGTRELYDFVGKFEIILDPYLAMLLNKLDVHPPRDKWERYLQLNNAHLATMDAVHLLDKLLKYDHQERLTAKEAMQHEYFYPVVNSGKTDVEMTTDSGHDSPDDFAIACASSSNGCKDLITQDLIRACLAHE